MPTTSPNPNPPRCRPIRLTLPTVTILPSIGFPLTQESQPAPCRLPNPQPPTPDPSQIRQALLSVESLELGNHDPHLWGMVQALRWAAGLPSEVPAVMGLAGSRSPPG